MFVSERYKCEQYISEQYKTVCRYADQVSNPEISLQHVGSESVTPVVFLHGLMGRGKNFLSSAKALEPGFKSILVDLPNHGASGWTERFDYEETADAVASALGREVRQPFHLVGHSMGGKVAMTLALRHPELVDRLVVVDIAPTDSSATGSQFEHLLGSLRALDLDALASRSEADSALERSIPDPTVRGFLLQNLRREGSGFVWQPNLELLYASLSSIAGFPESRGKRFENPTLWIAGGKSKYITDEAAPVMRGLFPSVRKATVKQAGHWVHSERPGEFQELLKRFFTA